VVIKYEGTSSMKKKFIAGKTVCFIDLSSLNIKENDALSICCKLKSEV
jgi:hypothetical protein